MTDEPWFTCNLAAVETRGPVVKLRPPEAVMDKAGFLETTRRQNRWKTIPREGFPSRLDANERIGRVGDLIVMGVLIVSGRAAEALRPFDLGEGGLYPVEIRHDKASKVLAGDWHFLNIATQKRALVPELSRVEENEYKRGTWRTPMHPQDSDIVVSRAALDGPDIWADPALFGGFLMSARAGEALRAVGALDSFGLKRCTLA